VPLNEGDDTGKRPKALRECDQANQQRGPNGERPESIDPVFADADARENPLLRRHPMIDAQSIVGAGKACPQ